MDWQERIELNPNVLVGKPVVKGTRMAVEFIIELLGQGWTEAQVLENYPRLKPDDTPAVLLPSLPCFACAGHGSLIY
jgi:uncharacterized protein (DUF433 family)